MSINLTEYSFRFLNKLFWDVIPHFESREVRPLLSFVFALYMVVQSTQPWHLWPFQRTLHHICRLLHPCGVDGLAMRRFRERYDRSLSVIPWVRVPSISQQKTDRSCSRLCLLHARTTPLTTASTNRSAADWVCVSFVSLFKVYPFSQEPQHIPIGFSENNITPARQCLANRLCFKFRHAEAGTKNDLRCRPFFRL